MPPEYLQIMSCTQWRVLPNIVLPNICRKKQLNGIHLQKPEPLQIIMDGVRGIQFCWRALVSLQAVASGEDRHQVGRQRVFIQVLSNPSTRFFLITNTPQVHVGQGKLSVFHNNRTVLTRDDTCSLRFNHLLGRESCCLFSRPTTQTQNDSTLSWDPYLINLHAECKYIFTSASCRVNAALMIIVAVQGFVVVVFSAPHSKKNIFYRLICQEKKLLNNCNCDPLTLFPFFL